MIYYQNNFFRKAIQKVNIKMNYQMDESMSPFFPPTRLSWIKTHASSPVQKKIKTPTYNTISPMRMMEIMVDHLFELQLLREADDLFSEEDLQKINDLIDFISHISISTRIELLSFAESSISPIVTYYRRYFQPLLNLMNNQCYRMELRHSQFNLEKNMKQEKASSKK